MSELIGGPSYFDESTNFKAADNQGRIVLFMGHTKTDTETEYGISTVADCQLIVAVEDDFSGYTEYAGWVFGKGLAPTIYNSELPVVVGRVNKHKTKSGREAWGLDELPDGELEAVRQWFNQNIVHADGQFAVKSDTDEAPF